MAGSRPRFLTDLTAGRFTNSSFLRNHCVLTKCVLRTLRCAKFFRMCKVLSAWNELESNLSTRREAFNMLFLVHFDFKHHEYILVLFYSLIFACTQFDTVTFLTSSCCSWSLKAATSRRASRCRGEIHPINSCSCKRTRDPTILSQQERILVER